MADSALPASTTGAGQRHATHAHTGDVEGAVRVRARINIPVDADEITHVLKVA